jgi:PIN domain nuclease of toxin-antitoxin system
MKLLLDTCVLLGFLADSAKLSGAARRAIEDPANPRFLSPISLLEIAIKLRIDKLKLDDPFAVTFPA